jgi:ABC-2 type transport system permease protein
MSTVEQTQSNPGSTLVTDSLVIARRGLKHIRRQPEALTDATIQPVIFVVLFAFVFGGAIDIPGGGGYKEFLMGGIFAQTIVFGCFGVAMALAYDRTNGAIDRFHSLPISRTAVLSGHSLASLARSLLPITLMSITGYVIGWRINGGLLDALAGFGLMIAFSFAMIWVGIMLGSVMKSPEGVQGVAFVVIFPITFIASTFVPTSTLPEPLKTFAEWNPVSSLAGSLRQLFDNPRAPALPGDPWPLHHPVAYTVLWVVAIVLICAPLAVRLYQRSIAS